MRLAQQLACAAAWIEAHEAIVRAQPQSASAIRLDAIHHLARHVRESCIALETYGRGPIGTADHAIQTATGCANPHCAFCIRMQCIDGVIAQAARIAAIAAIVVEAAGAPVEQVETAADRADPKVAVQILGHGARTRTAKRAGSVAAMRISRELSALAFDARQAAAERADP